MKTSVSIITINYNSLEDTINFLDTLSMSLNFSNLDLEVVVVDNASDQCPKSALEDYPWVKLVQSKYNLGFAGGNNLGILDSTGEFLFIVNNDTEVNLTDLEELIDQYRANAAYGILCPVIYSEDHSIQYAGYTELNPFTGRNRLIEKIHSRTGIEETSYPHGAAMLISRENVKKVGLMSENYFLYYEELDWGTRVRNGGLKVGVCMSSKIVHKESATVGKISDCKLYFITRNRILYARKHFSKTRKAIFTLFFLLVSSPKNMFSLLLKRNFQGLRTYWEAIWWNLKHDTGSTRLGYKFDHLLKGS